MKFIPHLSSYRGSTIFILSVLGLVLIGVFDYLTGPEIAFSIFYLVPISFAVWYAGLPIGVSLCILGSCIWLYLDIMTGLQYKSETVHYWNALVRFGFFLMFSLVLNARRLTERRLENARNEAENLATRLQEANTKIQEAMESKSRFTSMVSHELRTPLTAIKEGIAIVLDGSAGNINQDQHEFLELAKRDVDRLHRLINDVLDFTKLESGKTTFKMEDVLFRNLILEVVNSLKSVAINRDLFLEHEIDPALVVVYCDGDRIQQVITNLLNNAIKFTKRGGVTLQATLEAHQVKVSIKDTGIGIRPEHTHKLFQRFEQVNSISYREPGSTGLGLAICREIIEEHGGKIWVESDGSTGSKFIFTFPLRGKG